MMHGMELHLLSKDLKSDATKEWSELTEQQKKLFEGLYNYWKAHKENNTSLWDKEAAGGYIDEQFKTGESDAVKIDGPWATSSVSELVGSDDNLQIIPLSQITFNGQPLKHWKGGWGLGINARCEDNEEQMEIAEAFIKELINPENAKELFYATGKILENATIDNYQGIDKLQLKVIEVTYDSYKLMKIGLCLVNMDKFGIHGKMLYYHGLLKTLQMQKKHIRKLKHHLTV